jgi:hypothetical protein
MLLIFVEVECSLSYKIVYISTGINLSVENILLRQLVSIQFPLIAKAECVPRFSCCMHESVRALRILAFATLAAFFLRSRSNTGNDWLEDSVHLVTPALLRHNIRPTMDGLRQYAM